MGWILGLGPPTSTPLGGAPNFIVKSKAILWLFGASHLGYAMVKPFMQCYGFLGLKLIAPTLYAKDPKQNKRGGDVVCIHAR